MLCIFFCKWEGIIKNWIGNKLDVFYDHAYCNCERILLVCPITREPKDYTEIVNDISLCVLIVGIQSCSIAGTYASPQEYWFNYVNVVVCESVCVCVNFMGIYELYWMIVL